MIPPCDQTGVPRHFHSSTTSGSADRISARSRASISPLQSPSSSILASISAEGDSAFFDGLFFMGASWLGFLVLRSGLGNTNRADHQRARDREQQDDRVKRGRAERHD